MVGSEEYLTKPFTKEQLLRAVEQFSRYAERRTQSA
jgi:twitching motility two-component system response regulator PilG